MRASSLEKLIVRPRLEQKIMRIVFILKHRAGLLGFSFLFAVFAVTHGAMTIINFIELDGLNIIKDLLVDLDFSLDSLGSFFSSAADLLPLHHLALMVFNLAVMAVLAVFLSIYRQSFFGKRSNLQLS